MKNLSGKTLIFYSFQQKRQQQYNVVAFQSTQKDIRIKQVLQALPIDLSSGVYHFRFKSQFFQGEQKIIGWIDISNLMAKVPMISNSIYIKILKVKNNQFNKLFNLEKLKKSGLFQQKQEKKTSVNKKQQINNQNHPASINVPKVSQKRPQESKTIKEKEEVKKNQNLFQFQSTTNKSEDKKIPHETQQEKLKTFKDQMKQQEQDRQCERIAREELDEKINKWGYSGKKIINNLTTLLATLHQIWPQWEKVSLSDMLKPQDVQNICKKALIKTHPDKNRKQPFRTKYLSKRVFELINQAKKEPPK